MDNENVLGHAPQQLRLAILQRVCPGYRTALFRTLSRDRDLHTKLFIGENIPDSKANSTSNLEGIRVQRLRTRFVKIGRRIFPWHVGLVNELAKFTPELILCEGESHFIGYLQAICYKLFRNTHVALIHWSYISLPGEPLTKPGVAGKIKGYVRQFFDAHLLYSSYSKKCLVQLGVPADKAFVATNVGDVKKFLKLSGDLIASPAEARASLALPERFTVLYTGTLDRNKNPDMILALAKVCDPDEFNFVLLGSGQMLEELRTRVVREQLSNVYLPGRISAKLALYYRASDVLVIPGRGGIIISEAMAFGIPVVTFQADGTEYDLVRDRETGFHLLKGDLDDFRTAIETLQQNPAESLKMGKTGRQLVEKYFATDNMVTQIKKAARYAHDHRTGRVGKLKIY
jgi:glycosyltransferase involved in cell wall biosynthesis